MSNLLRVHIKAKVPFDLGRGSDLGEELTLCVGILHTPTSLLDVDFSPAEMVPNEFGGQTAMYYMTITGEDAVSTSFLERVILAITRAGGWILEAAFRDVENNQSTRYIPVPLLVKESNQLLIKEGKPNEGKMMSLWGTPDGLVEIRVHDENTDPGKVLVSADLDGKPPTPEEIGMAFVSKTKGMLWSEWSDELGKFIYLVSYSHALKPLPRPTETQSLMAGFDAILAVVKAVPR